jgi:hypothetical protein
MENKGLADTHEVIPYQDGYALQRKGAQSLVQDLFDPLGLNKEFVTPEETPAPVNTQTAPSIPGIDTKKLWEMTPDELSLSHGSEVIGKEADNKIYRETKVPVNNDIFNMVGVPEGNVFADYEALRKKHPDQFSSSGDVKDHVEYVMDNPTGVLPATKDGYTMLYRSNGGDKATVVEFNHRGGKYRVYSAYTLDKGQLGIKIQKAQRGVSEPDPANPTLTDVNEPLTQGGGVPSDTRHVELSENNITSQAGNVNKNSLVDSPQIVDGIRQNAKIGKIVPRKRIPGK